jgi:hypothetical protein
MTWNPPPNWPPPPSAGWTPEPGWQPDPAWGPAPDGWDFASPTAAPTAVGGIKRKVKAHPVWASAIAVIVAIIAIGAAAGPSKTTPTAATSPATRIPSPSPSPSSPAPVAPVANPDPMKVADWISRTGHSTHEVQIAIQSVQAGVRLLQSGQVGPSELAALSGLVKQSQDLCSDADLNMVNEVGNPLKSERQEAWYAADEFKDAMGKLRTYLDTQKPSDLSDFQTKYEEATRFWNEAVTKLWSYASIPKPPTV